MALYLIYFFCPWPEPEAKLQNMVIWNRLGFTRGFWKTLYSIRKITKHRVYERHIIHIYLKNNVSLSILNLCIHQGENIKEKNKKRKKWPLSIVIVSRQCVLTDLSYYRGIFPIRDLVFLTLALRFFLIWDICR